MRIVLTGGGTGGHIYPAIAVGKYLAEQNPDTKLLYIGTTRGLESKVVPEHAIDFEAIEITGFRRSLSLENFKTIMRFFKGVKRSKQLLKEFEADAVVGTGGYVCGPVVYAAAKLGIPTFIHEQNAIPGLTNKFLSQYASAVGVSFEQSLTQFPKAKRIDYTGNPCATNVLSTRKGEGLLSLGLTRDKKLVLMVGGSRGARAFNDAMLELGGKLDRFRDYHFLFVTGELYYESTIAKLKESGILAARNLTVTPYLHNMAAVLRDSVLAISRSGASSLAEMSALGLPSILIPSPNVTNNHQEANARSYVEAGAAEMILEKDLTGDSLLEQLTELLKSEDKLARMAEASKRLAVPDSAQRIVKVLQSIEK